MTQIGDAIIRYRKSYCQIIVTCDLKKNAHQSIKNYDIDHLGVRLWFLVPCDCIKGITRINKPLQLNDSNATLFQKQSFSAFISIMLSSHDFYCMLLDVSLFFF